MRRLLIALALLAALVAAPVRPAQAQAEPASLIADSIAVDGSSRLVAAGHVEIFFQGRRLRAARIVYDRASDRLEITGPIVLQDGADTILLADQADLAADLSEGILTSARLVLNQQLQLAASEIMRVGGRYTALGRTVASSCKVCAGNPTPLWEIRARRVVHDQLERQIYFDDAQFRVAGLPVFYFPRLRMPDPTLKRATGFLTARVRTTSGLGTGLKFPYFIRLGDSRDLTITPYLSSRNAKTLELRYRQAFRTGQIELSGAISSDQLLPGERRGYLLATGEFTLPRDFRLSFSGEVVSDPAYLLDYGLSSTDRIDNRVEITRTRRNEYIEARLINFNSIRDGDVNSTLPSIVGDLTWHRRFSPGLIGGEGGFRFQTHSHYRSSNSALDSDGDGIADGRDMARASLRVDWRRNWVLPGGVLGAVLGEGTADFYSITQDAAYAGTYTRLHGSAAVELRWPLVRAGANGVSQVIEPVLQLVWSPSDTETLPNEDSALVEFDEGNLFALNRFPGSDATERGARANIGASWTRLDPAGWSLGATVGRVIRARDLGQFGRASGLDGPRSDWLVALQLVTADGLKVTNRLVFDDSLAMTKAEMRMDLTGTRLGLSSGYVWAVADASENRPDTTSELALDARYQVTPGWQARLSGRYDFITAQTTKAAVGLEFRNECLLVDLSLSRRFTSSTSVAPTTDFGLSVDLLGFGSGAAAGPARTCRR